MDQVFDVKLVNLIQRRIRDGIMSLDDTFPCRPVVNVPLGRPPEVVQAINFKQLCERFGLQRKYLSLLKSLNKKGRLPQTHRNEFIIRLGIEQYSKIEHSRDPSTGRVRTYRGERARRSAAHKAKLEELNNAKPVIPFGARSATEQAAWLEEVNRKAELADQARRAALRPNTISQAEQDALDAEIAAVLNGLKQSGDS